MPEVSQTGVTSTFERSCVICPISLFPKSPTCCTPCLPNHQAAMESDSNSLSTIDLILQVRLLLEIILHPLSCLAVILNWQSFYKTRLPERLMYFTSAGWVDLPSEAVETIKRCFECRSLAAKVEIHGVPAVANLLGMVLVDSDGRMISIAWIDADGKSFFPKKELCGGIGRGTPSSAVPRPSFGSLADLERLEETNPKYKKVKNTFLRGMKEMDQGAKVTAVYSCNHSSTFGMSRLRAYEWTAEFTKASKSFNNVRYGWYGTDAKRLEAIISRGFGLEDAHLGCGAFGTGIYLTPRDFPGLSASYSKPDIDGEYHILLCHVILGKVEKVTRGSNQYVPSNEDYDSGINDLQNPRCYIVWTANMSTHIIPRYVVSFKVSKHLQEHWRRIQLVRASRLRRLAKPIPLRSPQEALLPRRPRHLDRYHRNKSRFL